MVVPVLWILPGKTPLFNKSSFLCKKIANKSNKEKNEILPTTIVKDKSTSCLFKSETRHYFLLYVYHK